MAAEIDIHIHVRTGSSTFKDIQPTKNYIHQQFAGILGLAFSNTLLVATYSTKNSEKKSINEAQHVNFSIKLANQLVSLELVNDKPLRSLSASKVNLHLGHKIVSLGHKNRVDVTTAGIVSERTIFTTKLITTASCVVLINHCAQQQLAVIVLNCISGHVIQKYGQKEK